MKKESHGTIERPCPLCGAPSRVALKRESQLLHRQFELYICNSCCFAFVNDPCTDYQEIYNEAYYDGFGADPLVCYNEELEDPDKALRKWEWEGITAWVNEIIATVPGVPAEPAILDYGCGNGRQAWHLRNNGFPNAHGWDIGWMADKAKNHGMPVLDEYPPLHSYDIVLAIEVIEHAADPLHMLSEIRSFLKPGGVLLLTTGNAAPWLHRLEMWSYVRPEIHLSFFTPKSLAMALAKTGFTAKQNQFSPAWREIISYKVAKNLGFKYDGSIPCLLAAMLYPFCRNIDKRYGVTAMPFGIAT